MTVIAVVFEPDASLGHDPMDEAKMDRRQGVLINGNEDFLLIHRQWDERFTNGSRMSVWSGGAWESMGIDDLMPICRLLDGNGLTDGDEP